jgi:hypothetical protein
MMPHDGKTQVSMDLGRLYANRFPRTTCRRKTPSGVCCAVNSSSDTCRATRSSWISAPGAVSSSATSSAVSGSPSIQRRRPQVHPAGTRVILAPSHALQGVDDDSVDIVFVSNFFEHLPDKQTFVATLRRSGGSCGAAANCSCCAQHSRRGRHAGTSSITDRVDGSILAEGVASVGLVMREVVPSFCHDAQPRAQHPRSSACI